MKMGRQLELSYTEFLEYNNELFYLDKDGNCLIMIVIDEDEKGFTLKFMNKKYNPIHFNRNNFDKIYLYEAFFD